MTITDALQLVLGRSPRAARLQALAEVPASLDAASVSALHRVAGDHTEDAVVRAAVIVYLARRGESANVEADAPAAVRSAMVRASDVLRTRAVVAGFEAGTAPEPLPRPDFAAAPANAPPIGIIDLPASERRRIAAISSPSATHVVGLHCGPNELALLAVPTRLDPAALLGAPARFGQIAVHHAAELDTWTVPYEVLTQPDGEALRIAVLDERGRPRFAGRAQLSKTGLQFTLHAARKPGVAPVSIEGMVMEGSLAITSARSGGPTLPVRTPVRWS